MSTGSIRSSASMIRFMVQALDFLAILVGGWLAYQIRFAPDWNHWVEMGPQARLLTLAASLFGASFFGKVYRMWPGGALVAMVGRVTLGWAICWVAVIVLLALTKTNEIFSRAWMVSWFVAAACTLAVGRAISFVAMAQMRRAGYMHKTVLLVGDSSLLTTVRQRVRQATWSGYDIVGTLGIDQSAELAAQDKDLRPDEIWIGLSMGDHERLDELMAALGQSTANIRLLPDLQMYQILNHGMSVTLGIPMVDISVSPMFGGRRLAKAVLDYTAAALILVLISPLMLLIALAVKLSSPGPVLFQQKRHGWNGEEIMVYKFRSMVVHQESHGGVTQATKQDARVTPIGRFLRKSSLDELPQFINVLQGRMSVVGPRPHALAHNQQYMERIDKYSLRHKVKPGITGWAQICGYRGETDTLDKMEDRIKHDLYYMEHWSLWMDIKIILLTPLATIQNKNAY
ncbi:MAG: undecaprenyl-phosphate glucose phosphotransferase [Rhodoferax sp.]|jgi:Undecaprenyl-phosphate glucose phosphotransferase|uniref:undecaprenyl-phosphate glucose phosphotransferase n=1 Tax=Rhodoferax sp. TaxID=50421 RepID=UPI001B6BFE0A|nr:undecaprenyl-phosphate glucose phosphotransferase [Rhodoferax sp.]MBP9736849.1 undecaprenyl-phosphate glucose phosphotransferase [Rhodoferax sp.]